MSAESHATSAKGLSVALLVLLALAGLSFGLRFAHLGAAGYPVALGIAAAKAGVVVVFFMEIALEKPAARFALAAGVTLVVVLLTLVVADIDTRTVPPLANPPGTAVRSAG